MWDQSPESFVDENGSNIDDNPEHLWPNWYSNGISPEDSPAWKRLEDGVGDNSRKVSEYKDSCFMHLYNDAGKAEWLWDVELDGR